MSRALWITAVILVILVIVGLVMLPSLRQAVQRISGKTRSAEEARHEVMQIPISTPTDMQVKAELYWLSAPMATSVEPTMVELPLSADPVERSKQLLNALIADAPDPAKRTLPADVSLLAFYLQPDGTGIADFSDALSAETPSGVLSEQAVVDSITQTLAANVEKVTQLKILIHGQEAETLAGHLDLTGLFPVTRPVAEPEAPAALPAGRKSKAATPPRVPNKSH